MFRLSLNRITETFDIDFTQFPHIVFLAVIILVSRIPFLDLGFSAFSNIETDFDSLAVVNSAYLIRYAHVYTVSRFPGSPLYEGINALFIGGGWLATNAATLVASFLAIVLFGKILNNLKSENRALLLVTFAFIPVIWINSAITMDYMWGLLFLLAAFERLLREKYQYSAIALSLAIGFRITSLVMILPLLSWMFYKKTSRKTIFSFLAIVIICSTIVFSPVLYRYGFEFLTYSPREIPSSEVFYGITAQLISIPAMIALLIAFISARKIPKTDFTYILSLIIVFIFILLFIYHPSKPAYLIPAVPWGLIVVSKSFPRTIVLLICVLLVLNGILSVNIHDDEPMIRLEQGSILKNYEERKSSVGQSKEFIESVSIVLDRG